MTIPILSEISENDYTPLEKKLFGQIDELVNIVVAQKKEIQALKDEIASLKGQKPKPKIPPSKLEGPKGNGRNNPKIPRGKHPRQKKTDKLKIHNRQRIKPKSIPKGAVYKGYKKFTVQDIIFQSYNTVYEVERWKRPDGTYITGELPNEIQGHFGPQLTVYILHQYHSCRVPEPLLLTQLREIGVKISSGQLNNILSQDKDSFHQEKDELLPAGIAATGQIQADDTGARHSGTNGYATVIGNEFFTSITSTDSKSRINFLQILHGADPEYLVTEDTADYVEMFKPSHWLRGYILTHASERAMNRDEWEKFLLEINIRSENEIRLVTEAALFASLIQKGIPRDLGVHADDAGQFNVFVRSLCWIHEERHYRKIVAANDKMREEIEKVREEIWDLYKGLKEYKMDPSEILKAELDSKFEALFKKRTSSPTLDKQLKKTYAKKDELLRVLDRPGTPLHNNMTETDVREYVVKRKISGGTRSIEGRKCRDTFVSLKKTCCKLGITFWEYLQDRITGTNGIPGLAEIIAQKSKFSPNTS
jgi:hypothetical protein